MPEKPTLLLAEDDENDIVFTKTACERAGNLMNIQVVRDGREVIRYLSGSDEFSDRTRYPMPEVVLLDTRLPAVSGLDVLE